ncbi:transglycosylase family protein [Mycobacterium sp.]|uniref:transglycosylase family protein n=1 Tax=Mycobacterium sp. TaxID=1785 RepID=UPI0031CF95FA
MGVASDVATADPINWEAIAQCESGGNWAADTGNGDYGGLQITEATWLANGGQGYPFQASPEQQIAVGNQIMSTQGPGAWPTCASRGDGEAPVGSLTNFLTFLTDHA